jgi:hypothetical protein
MDAGHTLDAADAHTFQEQFENAHSLVEREPHVIQRALVIFGVGFAALVATEAL